MTDIFIKINEKALFSKSLIYVRLDEKSWETLIIIKKKVHFRVKNSNKSKLIEEAINACIAEK